MQILSTLSKQAIVATLIAATGLPASMANAQFKVEYDAKAKAMVIAYDSVQGSEPFTLRARTQQSG